MMLPLKTTNHSSEYPLIFLKVHRQVTRDDKSVRPRKNISCFMLLILLLSSIGSFIPAAQSMAAPLFTIKVEPTTVFIRPPNCWATFTVYIENRAGEGQEPVFVRLMPAPIVTGGISPFTDKIFFDGMKWNEFPGKKAGNSVTVTFQGAPFAVGTYQLQIFACDEMGSFKKIEPPNCQVAVVDVVFQGGPGMGCEEFTPTPPPYTPPYTPPPPYDWWGWWRWRWHWPWEWWGWQWPWIVQQPFDFTIEVAPNTQSIKAGQSATYTVTAKLISGSSQPVALSMTGLPGGSTHTFTTQSGNPTFTSNLKISTETSTSAGTYQLTITGTGGGKIHSATATLAIDVSKTTSTLTIAASPSTLNPEESVSISGALTPAQATTVELIYQRPDGFEMTKHLTTTSTGTYTDTVKPEIPGMWSVKSRWQGDEKHFSAESSAANFFVQAPQENPWPLLFAVILIALVIVIAALVVRKRGGTTVSKLSVTQISKRYCAKCGSEIPEGSTYCMKCGEKA